VDVAQAPRGLPEARREEAPQGAEGAQAPAQGGAAARGRGREAPPGRAGQPRLMPRALILFMLGWMPVGALLIHALLIGLAAGRWAPLPRRPWRARPLPRVGWPKSLRCPLCGRLRRATAPGDRYCDSCRATAADETLGALPPAGFVR